MSAKTSLTHPLQIAEVYSAPGHGRIGISFCPGKVQTSAYSGRWERSLDIDLDAIATWGAAAVVSLVEDHELVALQVQAMGSAVRDRHMAWFHLPIVDVSTPDQHWEAEWLTAGPALRQMIRSGFNVFVHCKGGLGRAGTIAARLLVELGQDSDSAIEAVRAARSRGAIETPQQEDHVRKQAALAHCAPDISAQAIQDRAIGALLGLAIGDAVGTTLEFKRRDTYPRLTDMIGGGPFYLKAGDWTDDTAMAMALSVSLDQRGKIDETDLMDRFIDWWRNGSYSCTGDCFDIGNTTSAALRRYEKSGDPISGSTNPSDAGNGSLMRLSPVAVRFWHDREALRDAAARQSRTTHASPACVEACTLYADMIADAIEGKGLDQILTPEARSYASLIGPIAEGSWRWRHRSTIEASGYVVHALEASIWCVARSHDFESAILMAANLGDDADTTAAITGQLAGALYGASAIPAHWRKRVAWSERITAMAERLTASAMAELK